VRRACSSGTRAVIGCTVRAPCTNVQAVHPQPVHGIGRSAEGRDGRTRLRSLERGRRWPLPAPRTRGSLPMLDHVRRAVPGRSLHHASPCCASPR